MGQPNENEPEVDNAGNPVDEAPTPGVDLDNGHDPDEAVIENEAADEGDESDEPAEPAL